MGTLATEIRERQRRIAELRKELGQLEAELRDAKSALSGRPTAGRAKSRHGSTDAKRSRPIQPDSSVDWALRALKGIGQPTHIIELIEMIQTMGGPVVKQTTLVSNLSRYIKYGDTFTRTAKSTYGLLAFENNTQNDQG